MHGDHAHARTSELFPVLSAPLISSLGIRGAYVLPALGFLVAIASIASIGVALDQRRSWVFLATTATLCTPLFFYGLEFWEHAPAVGAAALATWLTVRARSAAGLVAAGALFGLAVLLRPEALWYAIALAISNRWHPEPLTLRQLAVVLAGIVIVWVPVGIASDLHSGRWLGVHIAANASAAARDWLNVRAEIARSWFFPGESCLAR